MIVALALIYIGTAVSQSVVRRRTLGFAEIAQIGMALLVGIGGAAWVFKEHQAGMLGLGIAALAGGIAFYGVSFRLFERDDKRNFRALSTFGLFLVVVGIFLPFPRSAFWILFCVCAVGCCWTAPRTSASASLARFVRTRSRTRKSHDSGGAGVHCAARR